MFQFYLKIVKFFWQHKLKEATMAVSGFDQT